MLSVLLTEMDGLESAAGAALIITEYCYVNIVDRCTAACMQDPIVRLIRNTLQKMTESYANSLQTLKACSIGPSD